MSRQTGFGTHDSSGRQLVWAGATAAAVVLLLVAAVAIVWTIGGRQDELPAIAGQAPQTPTPRALLFSEKKSTPPVGVTAPTTGVATEIAEPTTRPTRAGASGLAIEATPPTGSAPTNGSAAKGADAVLNASSTADFLPLASGSWAATDAGLVNDGSSAVAEEWLRLASVPGPEFAIEAEARVASVLPTVCDQSFGFTGGSPAANLMFGAGVIFPCTDGSPQARLTDVTTWQDGYNADPAIADAPFDPGNEWHTYRFELRDGEMRLLVDGKETLRGRADPGINPSASDVETGIWSQGIGLEVWRVTVFPMTER